MNNPEIFDGFDDTAHIAKRLARGEYWAELIERRPWTGLGFNAYRELPHMPFREVFGARPSYPEILQSHEFVTVFPHNFPLHVWAELGSFGILLATGFVASLLVNAAPVRPRDAGAAARVALLATVLLVFFLDSRSMDPAERRSARADGRARRRHADRS